MALKKTTDTSFGIRIDDAYHRVVGVSWSKTSVCGFSVASFATGQVGEAPFALNSHEFKPTVEGDNFIAQAYEHLKTLPEFADAVDC